MGNKEIRSEELLKRFQEGGDKAEGWLQGGNSFRFHVKSKLCRAKEPSSQEILLSGVSFPVQPDLKPAYFGAGTRS